ncbi:ATPase [cyanobacterium TDX16]|nr:ATPase [cyanobacterium TDX16]
MDISLYRLALSIEQPPSPMLVSPATLLSLVESVMELLGEKQISATLWLKLPSGKVWYASIQRYHEQVRVSDKTYVCYEQEAAIAQLSGNFPMVPVQLLPNSHLRRDYFLIVHSPQFCCMVLAHRSRLRRKKGKTKENTHQKKFLPLLSLCSFEGRVLQEVLKGIGHVVAQSVRWKLAQHKQPAIAPEVMQNWEALFACPSAPEPVLLERLFAKQVQQQDATRRTTFDELTGTLRRQNQALVNALTRKDESFGRMCEELRTPLTHMKTALSLLNSPHLKPPQKQRYLQILSSECDRQNSLINGLLELVQSDKTAEQTVLQPLKLSEIIPGVVSTYQPLAQEKGIMLAYTVSPDLPSIFCSNNWLRQIAINLLHNSIKFTPTGGQVWVKACTQGEYVQLEFRDTGIGISPNEIPKIFDRFYRVRSVSSEDLGGAGLGLTIVQQLLLRCGGSISVKSKVGEGSIFNVLLPIAPSK